MEPDSWRNSSLIPQPGEFVRPGDNDWTPLVYADFWFTLPGMIDASVEELDRAIVEWLETNRPNWFLLESLIEDGFFERTGIPVPEPVPLPGEARVPGAHERR